MQIGTIMQAYISPIHCHHYVHCSQQKTHQHHKPKKRWIMMNQQFIMSQPLCFKHHCYGFVRLPPAFLLFFIFRSLAVVCWPLQVLRTASTKPQDSICGDHREVLRLHDLRFVEMGEPICHLSESPWTKHENATKCIKMPQLSGFPLLKGVEPNCTWLDIRNCETIANCKSSVRP